MSKHPIFKSLLRDKTRKLLSDWLLYKANTIVKIEQDTGLSHTWVSMFEKGQINNMDVGRVETLYTYLSKKPLELH